ncbi:MAG: NADH oxidase [Chloroflexi bacterium]|nr:MAG: NADH oxidase [Chloroflexota bacterium]
MAEKLIIIGGVAAGMSAAAKARRVNPDLEIVVYEQSGYISYGACGFPYFIKGDIPAVDDLISRTPAQMAKQGITALVHHEVTAIHPAQQTVRVLNHKTGAEFTDRWHKLILATGARVTKPPIPGIQLPGVFTLRTVEDAVAIRKWLVEEKPKQGVIVGAGYIGLEMAEALRAHGVDVTIVDMAAQVMPTLDADMAEFVRDELAANGVKICLQQPVKSFVGPAQVEDVVRQVTTHVQNHGDTLSSHKLNGRFRIREVVTPNHVFPADIVIFGVGSRPNTAIAEAAGIRLGTTGAVAVDVEQRTSIPHIWAAGAVAEVFHLPLQTHTYIPLALTANKQGRIAGNNAAGGAVVRFGGVVGTAVVKAFDLTIAHAGLTEKYAAMHGLEAESVLIKASSRAHYMPGSEPIHVKLVYEKNTQRLLGAQMIGKDGVAKRIDVVAAALKSAWTVRDIANLDLAYAPPFAPVWDPLLVAANVALRQAKSP